MHLRVERSDSPYTGRVIINELLANNRAYVARHGHQVLPTEPQRHLAVLTCMD